VLAGSLDVTEHHAARLQSVSVEMSVCTKPNMVRILCACFGRGRRRATFVAKGLYAGIMRMDQASYRITAFVSSSTLRPSSATRQRPLFPLGALHWATSTDTRACPVQRDTPHHPHRTRMSG
jgi:hypothetical protein